MTTALPVEGQTNEVYFWHGNNYAKIRFTPSTNDDEIVFGPAKVTSHWKTFAQAGFTTVDAAVPVPGFPRQVYFFSGTRYVRVEYKAGTSEEKIVYGPYPITEQWPSLVKAGFDTVDAILPVPGEPNQAYFFSGNQYAKIKFEAGTKNDEVLYGPTKITSEWKTLNEAGFDKIDAAFPVPGHEGQAYFFSGSQYVKIEFVPSSSTEKILFGPKRTYEYWKTLASWGW
ncbi:Hemopexin-like domain-containing protein [Chaetomium sp. MPI-SDFR-AT-0129]|nr:Hemopexin-like domain-containing protein [Chaetomium sp. MPI-SDFR-AT-0129]